MQLVYYVLIMCHLFSYLFFFIVVFFFQAEDGIRDLVRSRGLGDVYKRQAFEWTHRAWFPRDTRLAGSPEFRPRQAAVQNLQVRFALPNLYCLTRNS